jgi:hypothetical protein
VPGERRIEVDTDCTAIGELLVEAAGDESVLTPGQRAHIRACPECRALAGAERVLDQLLETAVAPEDPVLQQRIAASLEPKRLWFRVLSLLPIVASLMAASLGMTLLGGVPGSSLLSRFPVWSSRGWTALLGAANDWLIAVTATTRTLYVALPSTVQIAAAVLAVIGLSTVVVVTRRWRAYSPWRSDG